MRTGAASPTTSQATLISPGSELARDAERHAILSPRSLASQADRLMVAGLRLPNRRAPWRLGRAPRAVKQLCKLRTTGGSV